MKKRVLGALICALFATHGAHAADAAQSSQAAAEAAGVTQRTGIEFHHMDKSVRAQDDFFRHLNGAWLRHTEIPADRSSWGSFNKLADDVQGHLQTIVEGLQKQKEYAPGSDGQKLLDFYQSYMQEAQIEQAGLKPLSPVLAQIEAAKDKRALAAVLTNLQRQGLATPFTLNIEQDLRNSSRYLPNLNQARLSLPEREFYLNQKDENMAQIRAKYLSHIERMLTLAGIDDAAAKAGRILALETALAQGHWSAVALRDPQTQYNKMDLAGLRKLVPEFDWEYFWQEAGVQAHSAELNVGQPSFMQHFGKLYASHSLPDWKLLLQWQALSSMAPYLPKALADEHFAFHSGVISGVTQQLPRWKRGMALLNRHLGELLGKQYVAQYFPPESKQRAQKMVDNFMRAFAQGIDQLDWMSEATRKEAHTKLSKMKTKIGYPDKWRDYGPLQVRAGDLIGNLQRSAAYRYNYDLQRLGKPIDRSEWYMPPQTVNAYFNPTMNEIVFPAAILQPPFFYAKADEAVNYGAIGAVIGHEISHAFDDEGSKFDGDGNLRNWFSEQDLKRFHERANRLVAQYEAFSPIPGYHVNGKLTLGENIADNSGLAVAYKAYQLSLGGKPAPVIDGMSGEQRFYLGFGQIWRSKMRDKAMMAYLKTNSHAPGEIRANGTLRNQHGFYQAFGVKEGDKMYLAPEQRVSIW
ncbi:M13 family metallopeptidase [Massilia sp. W12]|uniref:M13 family metallopeptidase n=1 Tax=Massilia sp. W12 TaxID=3126507 RepID=UPI0030D5EEEF